MDLYIIKTTSFDWLLFLFLHINTVRATVRDFKMSWCVLCPLSKIRIKMFWIVKEVFLLQGERNCYLWSVKWKSILRTFVRIVVSAEEKKALLTNLHEVNIALFKRSSTRKRLPPSLTSQCNPNTLLEPAKPFSRTIYKACCPGRFEMWTYWGKY